MGQADSEPVPYWRLSAFYFCFFGLLGALFPYWSLYLKSLGFAAAEIGLLLALPMVTKIIAPNLWGWLADHTGQRLRVIRLGALLSCLCFAGIFISQQFWMVAFVMVGYSFFWNAVLPQQEVITTSFLRDKPENYSRVRLWGSIGFIIFVLGSGAWFDRHSIAGLPLIGFLLLAGIFISSLVVPGPAQQTLSRPAQRFLRVLCQPAVAAFFVAGMLMQFSHGIYYSFFSLYMEAHHYSRGMIGVLWSVGVVAEVVLFVLMHRLLPRFGVRAIMAACLLLATLRWLLTGYFPQHLLLLVFAQSLHAFTFGAYHAAGIDGIRRLFEPGNQGKAQALYSAFCLGLGGAIGSWLGGLVWDYRSVLAFEMGALACFIALFVIWFYLKDPRL
ncbi:MFS transporter [Porticoccus sp.]